jgi:GrpB-like predicted nucleotidyltransferase (UPF0157 family)
MIKPVDEPIRIVAYDPTWPARFVEERLALEATIGAWVTGGIHHVSSTAAAKAGFIRMLGSAPAR